MGREAKFRKDLSMPGMMVEVATLLRAWADPEAHRG